MSDLEGCGALITLYYPPPDFEIYLNSLTASGIKVVLIDNTPGAENQFIEDPSIHHIRLGRNTGLAHALNVGLSMAKALGLGRLILLDQDSRLTSGIAQVLLDHIARTPLTIAGPRLTGVQKLFEHLTPIRGPVLLTSELPTSGMTFRISDIPEAFVFNEDLFLDYVDFDACWRLKISGIQCHQLQDITMVHALGIGTQRVLGFPINMPRTYRHYFQFRDSLYLAKRDYVPIRQRMRLLALLLIKFTMYPLLLPEGFQRLKWMVRGIRDYLRGITGIGALNANDRLH